MPLSSRIIKSMKTNNEKVSDWVIDTDYDYEQEEQEEVIDEVNEEAKEELELAQQKKNAVIKQAENDKQKMMDEAQAEIDQLKEETLKKAFEEGQAAGYEAGLKEGKEKGYQDAKNESENLVKQAQQTLTDAQIDIEEYSQEKKESLLSLSVHMAEKIVRDQLEQSPEGILELVNPILLQLDQKEDYVSLTVHSSNRHFMRERIPTLEKHYPGVRFVVLQDDAIDPLGCVVESAHKVVDVQVKKQLEAMIEEMKEREREM